MKAYIRQSGSGSGKTAFQVGRQYIRTDQDIDFKQGIFALEFGDEVYPAFFERSEWAGVNAMPHNDNFTTCKRR